jgi:vacuolar-type H+-ATPase subunit I/STV1
LEWIKRALHSAQEESVKNREEALALINSVKNDLSSRAKSEKSLMIAKFQECEQRESQLQNELGRLKTSKSGLEALITEAERKLAKTEALVQLTANQLDTKAGSWLNRLSSSMEQSIVALTSIVYQNEKTTETKMDGLRTEVATKFEGLSNDIAVVRGMISSQ